MQGTTWLISMSIFDGVNFIYYCSGIRISDLAVSLLLVPQNARSPFGDINNGDDESKQTQ